jgi:Phage tail protein (Tail_P2_I)
MAEPIYTYLGERLADRTAPLQPPEVDAKYEYLHGHLSEAMMQPYEDVALLVDPEDEDVSPWQPLFDIDLCPDFALPWLAQIVGVRLPTSITGDEAREYIRALSFEEVGKPSAIRAAVGIYLTGSKTVYFRERDEGDPYALEVVTVDSETPDPSAVQRALEASVPAGIIIRYRAVVGWDYEQMTIEGGLYSALPAKFVNYRALSENTRV